MRRLSVNPNDAQLVRIYTQKTNGGSPSIPDLTPIGGTAGNTADFEVVVEGEAGDVLAGSGQPYTLTISAIDLTDVSNPNDANNLFTKTVAESFSAAFGWPRYRKVFNIQLNDVPAVRDDLVQYFAVLNSQNQVDSSVESPRFTLTQ
jgi:hypothetical protein